MSGHAVADIPDILRTMFLPQHIKWALFRVELALCNDGAGTRERSSHGLTKTQSGKVGKILVVLSEEVLTLVKLSLPPM